MKPYTIPDPNLTAEFIEGLYNPNFLPDDLNLTNFIAEEVVQAEQVQAQVQSKTSQGVTRQIPITEAEAEAAAAQIKATLKRIEGVKSKVRAVRDHIDTMVRPATAGSNSSDAEISFTLDISKKPRIQRAIQKLFGYKTDTITYSMYKALLRAKSQIEREETDDYVAGKPKMQNLKGK